MTVAATMSRKHFSDWSTMDAPKAEVFNEAMEDMGCPLRIRQFTPEEVTKVLLENEAFLEEYGKSQRMAGDAAGEATSKSRPNVIHLHRRMQEGKWRWYLSKVFRLPNGGFADGISRMLACKESNTPFWTFVYEGVEPEDFQYFDEKAAARSDKDTLLNDDKNLSERHAGVEGQVLPRLHEELYGTRHTAVAPDQLLALKNKYPKEIAAAMEFVGKIKPPRPKLIARAHIVHVGIRGSKTAERLLRAFKLGQSSQSDINGKEMFLLGETVKRETRRLHDEKIYPALIEAIVAEEEGFNFKFDHEQMTDKHGVPQLIGIKCVVTKPRKRKSVD